MKWLSSAAVMAVAVLFLAGPAEAQEDKKTARLWKAKCGSCHGAEGKGDTEKGKQLKAPDLGDAKWQAKATDEGIKKTVVETQTKEIDGKKEELHGLKDELKPDQLDALVTYIRSLKR